VAFPQGINFRATLAFATDYPPNSGEAPEQTWFLTNYPRTTAQGNTVGWVISEDSGARDRVASNDDRIRGHHFHQSNSAYYRIDLPAAGNYVVRLASGDGNYSISTRVDILDTTTPLATLCNGTTSAANRFFDANGTEHTAANWPANNTPRSLTFSTTQLRLTNGGAGAGTNLSHFYIDVDSTVTKSLFPRRRRHTMGVLSHF
jgi:hypothetical protein